MRILIIRTFPSVLDPNGYNIQEIGFAKALVRCGAVCDVVLFNGKEENQEVLIEIKDKDVEVGSVKVYLRHGFGILKNGFFPGLSKIVKDYDVLQVHEYDQITSWKYYAWYKKKPVVIYHGPYFDEFNKGYNLKCKVFDNTFLRLKHSRDTLCFTKSNAAADFLKGKGFRKTVPIGVGLDVDNFGPVEAKAEREEEGIFNIVYVGKIEPRRNSFMLLDIIKEVSEKNPHIHFTVIGDGEKDYADQWLIKAEQLIGSNVLTYFKKKTQTELSEIYGKMDLMIFPSNYEIFGMVILEAMYFDLPVLSSFNGGSDTLITDGVDGRIIDGFEVSKWAEAILELVSHKELYISLKENLERKNHVIYTWDGIARKYIEIIDKYLAEN